MHKKNYNKLNKNIIHTFNKNNKENNYNLKKKRNIIYILKDTNIKNEKKKKNLRTKLMNIDMIPYDTIFIIYIHIFTLFLNNFPYFCFQTKD